MKKNSNLVAVSCDSFFPFPRVILQEIQRRLKAAHQE